MFPRARQLLTAAQLRELGELMMERKQELLAGSVAAVKRAGQGLVGAVSSLVGSDDEDDAAERGLRSSGDGGRRPPRASSGSRSGAGRARS